MAKVLSAFLCGLCIAAFLTCLPVFSAAQGSGLGLGVIVGEPTGLSLKAWIGGGGAVDVAAAWSFEGRDYLRFHVDYLRHFSPIEISSGSLPLYYGIGGRIGILENGYRGAADDDIRLGLRIPFGITYLFGRAPLDIFLEIAPVVDLIPSTDVDLDGGVGIRFYFK